MLNILLKIIVVPIVLILASKILPGVHFPYLYQPIVTGVVLALVGHLLEWALLKKETFWVSLVIDFVISAIFLYTFAYYYQDAYVTIFGVVLTSVVLTAIEFFVHLWLLGSGRARKEPSY
ncbi:hypothetical protein ACA30_02710 [Virgibacillus soli]|uniref:DUF2512 family protein n=1 Tax=Lederbergia galactosidilytica TaxID=217031 RepID=A0A0Q9XQ39_9BACI|nr:DUF2512 family protein [Lederbergia galactosidilytica]KRG09417.1 hypothetical protein ACA29_23915 [Lederbergia galactosidilytica]KRG16199.1 hypothetical protein ACA30_02710 [Virgibacillus soli]MBP1914070.1 putative membrane protein YeaQ/YmgE (transglycosylase-associated protein family) [Lederbergia galactosidilytica]